MVHINLIKIATKLRHTHETIEKKRWLRLWQHSQTSRKSLSLHHANARALTSGTHQTQYALCNRADAVRLCCMGHAVRYRRIDGAVTWTVVSK